MKVTNDTIIGDILDASAGTKPFFMEVGMHCFECPVSRMETVEQACAVHGADADALIKKLNDFFGE